MEALGIIGFLAFISCIVFLIWSAIKKKTKRYWAIGIGVSFILFIVGAVACSPPTSPVKTPNPVTPSANVDSTMPFDVQMSIYVSSMEPLLIQFSDAMPATPSEASVWSPKQIATLTQIYQQAQNIVPPAAAGDMNKLALGSMNEGILGVQACVAGNTIAGNGYFTLALTNVQTWNNAMSQYAIYH